MSLVIDRAIGWWSGHAALRFRAAVISALCIVCTVIYAIVVQKSYPLKDWLFWKVGPVIGYTLLWNLSSLAFGNFILRKVFRQEKLPIIETAVLSATLGVIAFCLGMYVGGTARMFNAIFAIALPVVYLAVGARSLAAFVRRAITAWQDAPRPTVSEAVTWTLALAVGSACAGLLYLQAMTPDAINFDAAWYHVPIAQDYAREGRIVPFPSDYNRAFPHLTSMNFTWGFIVPGLIAPTRWMMSLHLEYSVVLWKMVGVVAIAEWLLDGQRAKASWVVFFLFPSIFVYDQNIGGSADHFMGFFAIPIFLALVRTLDAFEPRYAALLGVMVGGAILTKYQAVYMIGTSAVCLAVRWVHVVVRDHLFRRAESGESPPSAGTAVIPMRRLLMAPALIIGACLLTSAPHFVKNAMFYGNPIYPFGQNIFATTHPLHAKSHFYFTHAYPNHQWEPQGKGLVRLWNTLRVLVTFSFAPHYSFTNNVPATGSLFTLLLPAALFIRQSKRIYLGIAASLLALTFWANTYIVDRYLHAILPLIIGTTAALIARVWEMGHIARVGLVGLVAFQILWGADALFYSGHDRLESAVNLIKSGFDKRRTNAQRFAYRSNHVALSNATPRDAKILVHNYRTTLGIDRTVYSDIQAWQSYFYYEPVHGVRELYDLYKARGVTHLLHPPSAAPIDTVQANVLFAHFMTVYATNKKRFGELEIAEMPTEPPPPDSPYQVLALGISGYPNGLYLLEQLTTYTRLPVELRGTAKPIKPVDAQTNDAIQQNARAATAVVIGDKIGSKVDVVAAIGRDFVAVNQFREYSIHVRRASVDRPGEPNQ